MSNKRITDLTELTTPTTDDVFPIVDIATNTTQKVQVGNLPIQTAVTTALATKQATLVSGTNIKTVNSTTLLGSGDIAVQPTLVSGTSIKTVNSNSLLGAGDVAVQPTLVSGTNIKTLNSVSLLGSGDIVLAATPSGVAGAIQFSNGSAFASDATNFFWDDTNNRLGIGTNAPTAVVHAIGASDTNSSIIFRGQNLSGADRFRVYADGWLLLQQANNRSVEINPGGYINFSNYSIGISMDTKLSVGPSAPGTATMNVKGSGSTSATTSLLVQNSSGTSLFSVRDDGVAAFSSAVSGGSFTGTIRTGFINSSGNAFTVIRTNDSNGNATFDYSVAIGTTSSPVASAVLEIVSTTKGVLFPRMTTTQKNAIATPAAGLVVYDSTTNKLCCYNGSTWNDLF